MRSIRRLLLSLLVFSPLFVSMGQLTQAAEMEADVGIEFTEILKKPDPKPDPVPDPPKPPIKKVIQLPQTGEKKSQGFTIVGAVLMIGAVVVIYKRKSEVAKE